jgi:hypothetical protein
MGRREISITKDDEQSVRNLERFDTIMDNDDDDNDMTTMTKKTNKLN